MAEDASPDHDQKLGDESQEHAGGGDGPIILTATDEHDDDAIADHGKTAATGQTPVPDENGITVDHLLGVYAQTEQSLIDAQVQLVCDSLILCLILFATDIHAFCRVSRRTAEIRAVLCQRQCLR